MRLRSALPGFSWSRSTSTSLGSPIGVVALVVLLTMVVMPVLAIAQDTGTPASDVPGAPAERQFGQQAPTDHVPVVEEPAAEEPVVQDPVTEVPPVVEEAPALPEDSSPEVPVAPEDGEPQEVPVLTNTDSVQIADGATTWYLAPGESRTINLVYTVTTSRTSTSLFAELAGASDEWTIESAAPVDADPATNLAAWTEQSTLEPGTYFQLPVTITAPSVLYADQAVSLRLWSTAATSAGSETGIAWSEASAANFTAVAPINTDSVTVAGEPTRALAAGEQTVVTVTYDTTTFRTGTTLQAVVVDEAGTIADGWGVAATSGVGNVGDATALVPGSSFQADFVVTAPTYIHANQTVTLRLSSTVATPLSNTLAIDAAPLSTFNSSATPASPAMTCDTSDIDVHCAVAAGRTDVTSATLSITAPAGWMFSINGSQVEAGGTLDLLIDGAVPADLTIETSYDGACFAAGTSHVATLSLDLAYTNVGPAFADVEVTLPVPAAPSVPPVVSIAPVDFGTIRWNGDAWDVASASTTVTVQRDGCGGSGSYDIQLQVTSADPGLELAVIGVESADAGIIPLKSFASPTGGAVTIARVDGDFTGTGTATLHLKLSPTADAAPGTNTISIQVTTVNGQ